MRILLEPPKTQRDAKVDITTGKKLNTSYNKKLKTHNKLVDNIELKQVLEKHVEKQKN